jgi:hypothetical protein
MPTDWCDMLRTSMGVGLTERQAAAETGDLHLLGVRTLEGFGVTVDSMAHRLVATATLAAVNTRSG